MDLIKGERNRIGFVLLMPDGAPAIREESTIRMRLSVHGDRFVPIDHAPVSVGFGFYYVDVYADWSWESPIMFRAWAKGTEQWRDIMGIQLRPPAPEPDQKPAPGTTVFMESFDRWSVHCDADLIAEMGTGSKTITRTANGAMHCQIFTVCSLQAGRHVFTFDSNSSEPFDLGIDVLDHEPPYHMHESRRVPLIQGRSGMSVHLEIPAAISTARLRFWLDRMPVGCRWEVSAGRLGYLGANQTG